MYLLFKDPHGKNAAVVNSQGDSKLSGFSTFQKQTNVVKCVELEKKVTLLELAVQEKDKTITLLRHEIGMSNSTMPTQEQVYYNKCCNRTRYNNVKHALISKHCIFLQEGILTE